MTFVSSVIDRRSVVAALAVGAIANVRLATLAGSWVETVAWLACFGLLCWLSARLLLEGLAKCVVGALFDELASRLPELLASTWGDQHRAGAAAREEAAPIEEPAPDGAEDQTTASASLTAGLTMAPAADFASHARADFGTIAAAMLEAADAAGESFVGGAIVIVSLRSDADPADPMRGDLRWRTAGAAWPVAYALQQASERHSEGLRQQFAAQNGRPN